MAGLILVVVACAGREREPNADAGQRHAARSPPCASTARLVTEFGLASGGKEYRILIDAQRDYGFGLPAPARTSGAPGDPVHVELEWRGEDAYARAIVDA